MSALALVAVLAVSACSEPAPKSSAGSSAGATPATTQCRTDDLLACARRSSIAALVPRAQVAAKGTPITLGMINQENTPAGSFPELSRADQAAVDFVNEQLGGLDGHPLKLVVCNTKFSAEGSTACGQQFVDAKVPAVLGGIDVFGNAIDTLRDNGIPYVGGIPVSNQSATSPNSFQFSGGTWGATIAFADYAATTLKAKRVAIVYGEFGSITQSAELGRKVLERHGVEVQLVPYPILATDISSALQAAASSKPDAVFVLAADTGCKGGFDGMHALAIRATSFYVGACASPTITRSVDPAETEGAIFNVEGLASRSIPNPDMDLYTAVVQRYGKGLDPIGAGTVSFRSFMNLYVVLRQLGAGKADAEAILESFRSKVDAPSFMGHPYTCDGKQLAGLPALCSPQQVLVKMHDGQLEQVGSWIDVGKVLAG